MGDVPDPSVRRKVGLNKSPPPFSVSGIIKWQPSWWQLILSHQHEGRQSPRLPLSHASRLALSMFRYFAAVVHVIVSTWILRGEFTMLFSTVLLSFCVMSWFQTRFLYSWFSFDPELCLGSKRVHFVLKEGYYMLLCMQSRTLMPVKCKMKIKL